MCEEKKKKETTKTTKCSFYINDIYPSSGMELLLWNGGS